MTVVDVMNQIDVIERAKGIICDISNEDTSAELRSDQTGDSIELLDLLDILMKYEHMLKMLPVKELK